MHYSMKKNIKYVKFKNNKKYFKPFIIKYIWLYDFAMFWIVNEKHVKFNKSLASIITVPTYILQKFWIKYWLKTMEKNHSSFVAEKKFLLDIPLKRIKTVYYNNENI